MTDRLAELEAKAVALNAEIAALKAGNAAPAPPPPKDEVRIVPILTEPSGLPNLPKWRSCSPLCGVSRRGPRRSSTATTNTGRSGVSAARSGGCRACRGAIGPMGR